MKKRDFIQFMIEYVGTLVTNSSKRIRLILFKLKQKKAGHINASGSLSLNIFISVYQERPSVLLQRQQSFLVMLFLLMSS